MTRRWVHVVRAAILLAVAVLVGACGIGSGGGPVPIGSLIPAAPPVAQFECQDAEFSVDLLDAVGALPEDTLEAQREQLRDWVWMVTLGRLAKRTSAEDVLPGVADQPVARDDALAHVLTMPVGPARAATTKSGDVVVMVEHASKEAMAAVAIEAIDQEALYLGHLPERALVYGYAIEPEAARARVCSLGRMDRSVLESTAQGYRRAQIASARDLEQFLAGGVDLLTAECTDAGLSVTGRSRPRSVRGAVTAEHVAAIARTLGTRYIAPERFGATVAGLPREQRAGIDAGARALDALWARRPQIETAIDAYTPGDRPTLRTLIAWKTDNPTARSADVVLSLQLQSTFAGRPGFSLDPTSTTAATVRGLDEAIAALKDARSLAGLIRAWGSAETANDVTELVDAKGPALVDQVRAELRTTRAQVAHSDDRAIDGIMNGARGKRSPASAVSHEITRLVYQRSSQQCARYDGPLAGTATGMTLFYTDLLAKLSALDWQGAAPEEAVDGFVSVVHQTGSTASCEEEQHPNTRLWFGLREEHYARGASGGLQFAPIATRIFAKGSIPGGEGEVEPDADTLRFIRWWDRHYVAVAEWEPQYEVLNQIMKWSVVAQSAALSGKASCLGFLDQVEVPSGQRFDRWVAATPGLRWRGPVKLVSDASRPTECLPLFASEDFVECGNQGHFSGGVSAATREQVAAKPLRVLDAPSGLGRFGVEAKPTTVAEGRVQFGKVRRSGGELSSVEVKSRAGSVTFRADVDTAASQRGAVASWQKGNSVQQIEKTVDVGAQGLVARQRTNGLLTSELRAYDLEKLSVRVEVKPGVQAEAQRLAGHMAYTDGSLADAAGALPARNEVHVLADGRVAVRFTEEGTGNGYYAVMSSGGGNRGPPGEVARFQVGAADGGAHRPGGSRASRNATVHVSILPEAEGKSYVAAQSGKPIASRNETLLTVEAKLKNGDVGGAFAAVEAKPTPEASARVLRHALENDDGPTIQRIAARARSRNASVAEIRELRNEVSRARVLRKRSGGDTAAIDQLGFKLGVGERSRLMAGLREERILAAKAGDMTWYAPVDYPAQAGLPPPVHPAGKPLPPSKRFVSRVVEESYAWSTPQSLELDGTSYQRRGGGTGGRRTAAASEVGSPYRLFASVGGAAGGALAVVLGCSDDDDDRDDAHRNDDTKGERLRRRALPPCHEPESREHRERAEAAKRQASAIVAKCDTDKDGAISTPPEAACLRSEIEKLRKTLDAGASR